MKLMQMKWHDAYLSISAAMLEMLSIWENGVLTLESLQKTTNNIKGKVMQSGSVCHGLACGPYPGSGAGWMWEVIADDLTAGGTTL
jgi:hypothetical protein